LAINKKYNADALIQQKEKKNKKKEKNFNEQ